MIKIRTVFVDMDGVLTDFNKSICWLFDLPYPPYEYDYFEDIRDGVDAACTIQFWAELKWTSFGEDLLTLLENRFSTEQIYILTKPMLNTGSPTGKAIWIKKNIPRYYDRVIITRAPKSLLARPGVLLIDDHEKNINGFEKAGGNGILVPTTQNKLRGMIPYSLVKATLDNVVNVGPYMPIPGPDAATSGHGQ